MSNNIKPVLILISGGSGSGKSTIATEVSKELDKDFGEPCSIILGMDNYYKEINNMDPELVKARNYDHPDMLDMLLFLDDIQKLIQGKPIRIPNYCNLTNTRAGFKEETQPAQFIIIEGIFALENKDINKLATNIFFIEVDEQERQIRIIKRNLMYPRNEGETKETIIEKLEQTVFPMHEKYIEPKKRLANVIIKNPNSDDNIETLVRQITRFITNHFNFSNYCPQEDNSSLQVYDLETKELELQKVVITDQLKQPSRTYDLETKELELQKVTSEQENLLSFS